MTMSALLGLPIASQAVLRVGWFTVHGTAALVPFLVLLWLAAWIHSGRSTRKH